MRIAVHVTHIKAVASEFLVSSLFRRGLLCVPELANSKAQLHMMPTGSCLHAHCRASIAGACKYTPHRFVSS